MNLADVSSQEGPFIADADLVRRAKERDQAVWSMWHDQHYPFIYRYARSRLGNREDAEDIASQVFLEALKSIDRYRYQGRPILAWLYGIAQHLVSRRFREAKRTATLSELPETEDAPLAGTDDAVVNRIVFKEGLAKLKPEHRDVLILRFILGLPTREVAEIMGKSEAATYSLQVRAASALRREIA
ncbi:MAG TPA: sigma-70 family RNA polymerase sigma factor [Dehalococcoidia bacterium]|nr:sigma-70 family RNA polymerase sigma factor [Dehalococcoidia bacterium]